MKSLNRIIPPVPLIGYIVLFALCAIDPYSRSVWWAENLPILGLVLMLGVLWYRGIRFSPLAYVLASIFLYIHTVGSYYTFERVPFDWFNDFFGFERNMYDRVGHFSVGLWAVLLAEWVAYYRGVSSRFVFVTYPILVIAFVAVGYEWIEWIYAVQEGGSAGLAFLGSQGDIWDAQKDMLMDVSGALICIPLMWQRFKK
jgi:putative membrane protein